MATKVDLVNIAFARLGAPSITSLSDSTDGARLASTVVDQAIEEVLCEGAWTSAVKRAVLSSTTAPTYGYTHAFSLPADFLRIIEVNEHLVVNEDYKIEGLTLVSDTTPIKIKYIATIDPSSFDPNLQRAVVAKLVADMAMPLTNSGPIARDKEAIYRDILNDALAMDGLAGSIDRLNSSELTEVRS